MKKILTGLVTAVILSPLCANSAVVGDIDGNGRIDT
jgi:hypothetical protein